MLSCPYDEHSVLLSSNLPLAVPPAFDDNYVERIATIKRKLFLK